MGEISLEIEGYKTVENPSSAYITKALEHITPRVPSIFILTRPDGSFVQAAGSKTRLTVEARFMRANGGFQHVIVGVEDDDKELTHIAYSSGTLVVQKSEVLKLPDAQTIFSSFLRTGYIPMPYINRDVTKLYENEGG